MAPCIIIEMLLNLVEQLLVDDRIMTAFVNLALVGDLAGVKAMAQKVE